MLLLDAVNIMWETRVEPQYGEQKTVKQSVYAPPKIGYFAVDDEHLLSWEKCRETFAYKFTEVLHGFYFCHVLNEGYNVASFIAKTEEIIGFVDYLYSFAPSKFCKTNQGDVLWVEPSRFWSKYEIRRQLFTILLRAGMNYNPSVNNYEEALWGEDKIGNSYARETQLAITRFLFGFTCPVDSKNLYGYKVGWRETFKDCSEQAVRRMLIRPEGEKKEISAIGLGKLWI